MTDDIHDGTAFRWSIAWATVIGLLVNVGIVFAGHRYVLAHPGPIACRTACGGLDPLAEGLRSIGPSLGNAAVVTLSYFAGVTAVGVILGWTQLRHLRRTSGVGVALWVAMVAGFIALVLLPVAKSSGSAALTIWVTTTLLIPPILMGLICSLAKPPPIDWAAP